MATSQTSKFIQHLRTSVLLWDGAGLTDGQLLGCFVEHRDEAAFAALVRRLGPMVWGVCRRLLEHHDAEDAFQASWLVLVRKAASIRPREMVSNWLYGVAHQTALQARRTAARKRAKERRVTQMPGPEAVQRDLWPDLQPLLDRELSSLPDKYRTVIILCYLDGKTRKEAARQLGCPEGTIAGRLARAKLMLAKRLARHGVGVSGGALAAVLSQQVAPACVPASVTYSTIKAASLFATGQTAATALTSAKVAALTEGVLKAMFLGKLKMLMTIFLMLSFLTAGGKLLSHNTIRADPSEKFSTLPAKPPAEPNNSQGVQPERDLFDDAMEAGSKLPPELWAYALSRLAAAQLEAKDKRGARATLQKVVEVTGKLRDKDGMLLYIAESQIEADDYPAVAHTLADIQRSSLPIELSWRPVNASALVARALATGGDRAAAKDVFRVATEQAMALSKAKQRGYVDSPSCLALEALGKAQLAIGDEEACFRTAELMKTASGKAWYAWSMWHKIALKRAQAADLKGALEIVSKIKKEYDRSRNSGALKAAQNGVEFPELDYVEARLLEEIVTARTKAGDSAGAWEIAQKLPKASSYRMWALRSIGRLQATQDEKVALNTAATLESAAEKALVLQAVAEAQARKGDMKLARATLEEALKLAMLHSVDVATIVQALVLIAESQAKNGDVQAAFKTAQAIPTSLVYFESWKLSDTPFQWRSHPDTALALIARAQSRRGDIEGALETAKAITRKQDPNTGDEDTYSRYLRGFCIHEVARAKVKKDGDQAALAWAKSRPTADEKAWALQGVAEEAAQKRAAMRPR
jgi:RNA polymerase sigma factor (sigma-70 family)